ncbi:hypothetical protein AAYR83_003715 [Salmonella enterica]|nr:hypothetical protein [Salmonella enterica]EJD0489404.1 hypothetical protein [Salmonella enterica]EKI5631905.1 hypothetical protein [Salmonella enterica]ELU1573103.1 hypothetical protein [Salmonella enterica]
MSTTGAPAALPAFSIVASTDFPLMLFTSGFAWPRDGDSAWSLTQEPFDWLVSGIDWQKMTGHDLAKWA